MHFASLFCFLMIFHTNAKVILESNTKTTTNTKRTPMKSWLFKDYMKKFEISKVWKDLQEKSKKAGKKVDWKGEFDNVMSKIDETDELLSLKVEKGDPKLFVTKNGRRADLGDWNLDSKAHPGFEEFGVFRPQEYNVIQPYRPRNERVMDPFYVRYRINELMKQLIYDTRLRLIGWQHKREQNRHDPLYKMGFAISKVDEIVKSFIRLANRSYKGCFYFRQKYAVFDDLSTVLETLERMLFRWFTIDLYYEFLMANDNNARAIIANTSEGRRAKWKFID